jgi:hypothetical protein
MVGIPAHSQTVFLDVDGDGLNSIATGGTGNDVLSSTTTSVDIYFVTNQNPDGSTADCAVSADPMTIFSYDVTILASGSGSVSYGTWTDNMGFTFKTTACAGEYCTGGQAAWIGYGSSTPQAPGKYKIGTLAIVVTGTPKLDIVATHAPLSPNSLTAFGSNCPGNLGLATIFMGDDFPSANAFGTESPTDVVPTTWGKIKDLYR